MASLEELKNVIKETLDKKGTLSKIKAQIRAEIFTSLETEAVPKPKLSNENILINELIREYFTYNHYNHALSVFLHESGQPIDPPFDKKFIAKELKVDDKDISVPLLYSLAFGAAAEVQTRPENEKAKK